MSSWEAGNTLEINEHDHVQGARDASVTLIEYGDFECPYCGAAYPIVKELVEQMGDRVCFVFRQFPLTQVHPHAEKAAEASEAAGAQGKFWEMHDTLYENQDRLEINSLVRYAGELTLDTERFSSELGDGAYEEQVRTDFMGGVRSGVNGTPTFFINGERFNGDWQGGELMEALESA
jgi:protein-disulfide isomerase